MKVTKRIMSYFSIKVFFIGLSLFSAITFDLGAETKYPSKPIKLIVPYPPGGAADISARFIAQGMSLGLGQSIIIDNRPGANGMIGTDLVAKSVPDGYTLLFTASGPIVVNPVLYKKVPYDSQKDFIPVCLGTSYQYALVVPYASPIKSISDLIEIAKQKPGALSYGSTGVGGGGHLAGELLALMAGVEMTHVPYKGAAPALSDLLANQLSFTFEPIVTAVPMIKANKLRGFAVSGIKRSKAITNLATLDELGYSGFNVTQFQGLLAPAGTDPEIIKKLNTEMVKVLKSPQAIQRLVEEGGNEIIASTPAEFVLRIQSDLNQYTKLITDAHIHAE